VPHLPLDTLPYLIGPVPGLDGGRAETLRLPSRCASAGAARRWVRTRLDQWGARLSVRDDVELLVSELFTNALLHTHARLITCHLVSAPALMCVEVSDQGRGLLSPRMREIRVDDGSGPGLMLVHALSGGTWGIRRAEHGSGRAVWAALAC
jgi:serine/threonine-protein kinase RsbW